MQEKGLNKFHAINKIACLAALWVGHTYYEDMDIGNWIGIVFQSFFKHSRPTFLAVEILNKKVRVISH